MLLNYLKGKVAIVHRLGRIHSNVDPLLRYFIQRTYAVAVTEGTKEAFIRGYDRDPYWKEALGKGNGFVRLDGLIFKEEAGCQTTPPLRRLCVPEDSEQDRLREGILPSLHDARGHPGQKRILLEATEKFFWPGMCKQIKEHCKACVICRTSKDDTTAKPGELQPFGAPFPLHNICMDFVDGLPDSGKCKYDSFCLITDKYTKFVRLIPCKKSQTAEQFAEKYFDTVYGT